MLATFEEWNLYGGDWRELENRGEGFVSAASGPSGAAALRGTCGTCGTASGRRAWATGARATGDGVR